MASIFKQKDIWHVKFYYRGKPYKKSLGEVPEHKALRAKQRVQARLADLKAGFLKLPEGADVAEFLVRGQVVTPEEISEIQETFEEVKASYLQHAEVRRAPSSLATEKVHLGHLERFLGNRVALPMSDISAADIERFLTQRRQKVSGATANKELQTLRQVFDYGMKHGYIKSNPTYSVDRFKNSGTPHRFMTKPEIDTRIERGGLSGEEIKKLWHFRYLTKDEIRDLIDLAQERDPWIYPVLVTLAFTGMRRGELVALEWGDLDFKANKVWIRSRKQSRTEEFAGRDIDMHERLAEVLVRHRKRNPQGRYVFPGADGKPLKPDQLHRAFKSLIKGTGFDEIGLHCLRHSFASNLAAQGVDDRLIDHYLGHQTSEMRRRYQHLFPEKKSEGIRRLPY